MPVAVNLRCRRRGRSCYARSVATDDASEYIGIIYHEDEGLWFAFGDTWGDLGALEHGWAITAEDAAWIREGLLLMESVTDAETPPRNFPDADKETVHQRFVAACDRFEAWVADGHRRPFPPVLFAFEFDEAERDLDGGALGDQPLIAAFVRSVRSGALVPGASTAHDYLMALSDDLLDQLRMELLSDEYDLDVEEEAPGGFDVARLVVALIWLELGETPGASARRIDEGLDVLAFLVDIETGRRAGTVRMIAPATITGDPDVIVAEPVEKGEDEEERPESPPESVS